MSKSIKIGQTDFTLGGYSFIHQLGEGASATVWLVADETTGNKYAVKIFHKLLGDADSCLRFDRECKSLSLLKHPNITVLTKWGVFKNIPWLMFRYEESVTLEQYMKSGGCLSPQEVSTILSGICRGLEYAHGKKIVHRDLKPENILIKGDLTPVIIDFGMAKSQIQNTINTATGLIVGTPSYMAPEILTGEAKASSASDTYSVAVILYEMLEGHRLYKSENLGVLIGKIGKGDHEPPLVTARLSSGLALLIENAIETNPESRTFSSVGAFYRSISRELNSETILLQKGSEEPIPTKKMGVPDLNFHVGVPGGTRVSSGRNQVLPRVLLFAFIMIAGCFMVFLPNSGSDEAKLYALALHEDYLSLGKIAVATEEFAALSSNQSYISLAGRILAVRVLLKNNPSKAYDVYFQTLQQPYLRETHFDAALFQDMKGNFPVLECAQVENLKSWIANIVYYNRDSYPEEGFIAFEEYLSTLQAQERVFLKIGAFLECSVKKSFPWRSEAHVFSEVLQLLNDLAQLKIPHASYDYFRNRERKRETLIYLKKTGSELSFYFSGVFPERNTGGSKGEHPVSVDVEFEKNRLPLAMAYLAAMNLELVETIVLSSNNTNKEAFIRQKAWKYFSPFLGKDLDTHIAPLIPAYIFPVDVLILLIKFGALVGEERRINDAFIHWCDNYPNDVSGAEKMNDLVFTTLGNYLLSEHNTKGPSLEEALSNPVELKKKNELFIDLVPDFDKITRFNFSDDTARYLSFLLNSQVRLEFYEEASQLLLVLLRNISGKPIESSDVFNNISRILYAYYSLEKEKELKRALCTYITSLPHNSICRGRLLLLLLSTVISDTDVERFYGRNSVSLDELKSVAVRVKKEDWFSHFPELEHVSDINIGKAAWSERVHLSRDNKDYSNVFPVKLSFGTKAPSDADILLDWWIFISAFTEESNADHVRYFIQNDLQKMRETLLATKGGKGHALYPFILSQGLRRCEKKNDVDNCPGEQRELAHQLTEFIRANIQKMDHELFLSLTYYLSENIVDQRYEPVSENIVALINLVRDNCTRVNPLILHRELFCLAENLTPHLFRKVNLPRKERLKLFREFNSMIPIRSLRVEGVKVLDYMLQLPPSAFPKERWRLVYALAQSCAAIGENKRAIDVIASFPELQIPFRKREIFFRILIKSHFMLYNLFRSEGNMDAMKKELSTLVPMMKKYKTLPGASSYYRTQMENAIYDKNVRNIGLLMDL